MARKQSLKQAIDEAGIGIDGLAKESGLAFATVRNAVNGDSSSQLNTSSATAIAHALGKDVDMINWPGGLTNVGRPGGSYRPTLVA